MKSTASKPPEQPLLMVPDRIMIINLGKQFTFGAEEQILPGRLQTLSGTDLRES